MPAEPGALRYRSGPGRWVIAATVLGSGLAAIDATVVGIALPTIGREYHAGMGPLQWVVTGYTLTLASFLLLGGSLADRFGRRRVFQIGVVWFVAASAAASVAPGPTALIVIRVAQGVGAALLTPGSLAIIQSSFAPDDRGRAIGAWSGLGGVANAAGPLLGGYLITAASWRWIFLINVPLGAVVLAVSARHVPDSVDPQAAGTVDPAGAVLAATALGGIVYGLIEGPSRGFGSPAVVTALAGGVLAAVAFVTVERRAPAPMLPLHVFRVRQFSVTNAVTLLVYAALGGVLFLLPVELQVVDGYSPLDSGMALLPLTVIMLLLSARSGRLAGRIGPRLQMTAGPLIVGAGIALLGRSAGDRSYLTGVLPAVIVLALGLATTVAPLTTTALGALADRHAGLASAVNNDVARVGSLLAVAALPALAGIDGRSYLDPAVLGDQFRTAVWIAGSWAAVGGVVAGFGIRNPAPAVADVAPAHVHGPECRHCGLDAPPLAATEIE